MFLEHCKRKLATQPGLTNISADACNSDGTFNKLSPQWCVLSTVDLTVYLSTT